MNWTAGIISLGAVFATTSVLVVFQMGQPRIFFSMARDGLLPAWAAQGPSEVPHAARHHDPDRRVRRRVRRPREHRRDRAAHQHRHAVRVRAGGGRHHHPAAHRSRTAPRPFRTPLVPLVPLLAVLVVRLPDGAAALGDLGAVRRLAGDRAGDLLLYGARRSELRRRRSREGRDGLASRRARARW